MINESHPAFSKYLKAIGSDNVQALHEINNLIDLVEKDLSTDKVSRKALLIRLLGYKVSDLAVLGRTDEASRLLFDITSQSCAISLLIGARKALKDLKDYELALLWAERSENLLRQGDPELEEECEGEVEDFLQESWWWAAYALDKLEVPDERFEDFWEKVLSAEPLLVVGPAEILLEKWIEEARFKTQTYCAVSHLLEQMSPKSQTARSLKQLLKVARQRL